MPYKWLYSAVLVPGSGEEFWWSVSDVDAFKAKDDEYFAKGFRIAAADRHHDRHIGVWRPGSGGQRWISGVDMFTFKLMDASFFAQGLRLTMLDTDDGDFFAVWRAGDGGQHWQSGMSTSEFSAIDSSYISKGYRLQAIDIDNNGFIAAVWRPGQGAQFSWHGTGFENFQAKDAFYRAKGLRLELFDRRSDIWMGTWKTGPGPYYWWSGLTLDELQQKEKELLQQGLRLTAVDLIRTIVSEPNQQDYKIALRIEHDGFVDSVLNTAFVLTGPDGKTFSASLSGTGQVTVDLPDDYDHVGGWKVDCHTTFKGQIPPNPEATHTLEDVFSKDWHPPAGPIAMWTFRIEAQSDPNHAHFVLSSS